jgi:site-specific DNA-methyltransferase (adenine-specific)
MLDSLEKQWKINNHGKSIWEDKFVTFLDPAAKSGVFLREIVKRLNIGLSKEIPDLTTRINHILKNQVFGLAITELTALLSRRSLYCSKSAISNHSITREFSNPEGNIAFGDFVHTWKSKRCSYCGAGQDDYERNDGLESHAYGFIHIDDISKFSKENFGGNMRFDVIIGNPPYQLSDGGAQASARPIYHLFVQQAKKLEPKYLIMITPSRWFAGGKGLDDFRAEMLQDNRLRVITDFVLDKDAFPNVNINGGVSYFLWDRDHAGECEITTISPGGKVGEPMQRKLNEYDIFVRRNESVSILRKVKSKKEPTFEKRVSTLKPFGLRTFFHGSSVKRSNIKLYGSGKISWVSIKDIENNHNWVDKWKVLIPAATDGNENYPLPIWDQGGPFVSGPGEACTETYLVASLAKSEKEAKVIAAYMRTKFFRFMVSLRKVAQHNKVDNFSFVPDIELDHFWTDDELYKRYKLSKEEIEFIDSMIRTVEFTNE